MNNKLSRRDMLKVMGTSAAGAGIGLTIPGGLTLAEAVAQGACEMDWTPTYPAFDKYDPPVEISTPYIVDAPFPEGDDFLNNPMHNRVSEQLGINYTIAWQAVGQERTTRIATDIAAGSLPEMFAAGDTTLSLLIENDAVADITDIWNATASDLVKEKKRYPDGDNWVSSVVRGDRIYGVAFTYGPAWNVDNIGHIRQDFLDSVGLPMPTTVEELENAMREFKGAGLCEFGVSACQNLVTWYNSLDPIFGAYGSMPKRWIANEDGTLRWGGLDPSNKQALEVLRRWYADGLIDPDFFTYGEGDAAQLWQGSRVGVWFAPWWIAGGGLRSFYELTPGAQAAIMPTPAGPDGLVGRAGSSTRGTGVVFRSDIDPQKIEAAIKQLNWQMDMHVNWTDYQQYGEFRNSNGFTQGYTWEFDENCNVVAGPNFPDQEYQFVNEVGFGFPYMCYPEYQADIYADMGEWLTADPSTLNSAQQFLISQDAIVREIQYYNHVFETRDEGYVDAFLGANTERMTELLPDLNTMEDSAYTEILIGARDLDAFDQYVEDWLAMGGAEVTEDVNAWKASIS
ncbi:MAG: extracellular solute-binding protein [Anaerolineae bacterium]|nr:extracellular solute-binding protein [Anaerolineae bacterium]